MSDKFLFTFRLTPKRSLIAILVASTLTFLTVKCGINQEDLLKLYNEIRKGIKFDLPNENSIMKEIDMQLNERINKNPRLLDYKIRSEVDDAISQYEWMEKQNYTPNMKNKVILKEIEDSNYSDTQKQILKDAIYYEFDDGTMGIRGAWVTPDPREIHLDNENK